MFGSGNMGISSAARHSDQSAALRSHLPDDGQIAFGGTMTDWCDLGFSICETYLLEAQGLYLDGDCAGLLALAEAQVDPELEAEVIAHLNSLLRGLALRRQDGRVRLVETQGPLGLNWPVLADLWQAMDSAKGDMRMPSLAPPL